MSKGIKGKTVVITGAGGVLCSEFARHIAKLGGKVALLNRTFSKVEKIKFFYYYRFLLLDCDHSPQNLQGDPYSK